MQTHQRPLYAALCTSMLLLSIGARADELVAPETLDTTLALQAPQQAPGPLLEEAPEGVTFGKAMTFRGTGCSAADVLPLVREDGKSVTIYFRKFNIELLDTEFTKFATCWVGYDIHPPPGYTYTVTQFYYNLQAEVPEGVQPSLSVSYGFEGEGPPVGSQEDLPPNRPGEPLRPHGVRHVITQTKWAPCSAPRKLQAKVNIALANGTPGQFAKLELIQIDGRTNREGEGGVELELAWAKCPDSSDDATR
jgi:hypothetical protein